MEEGGRREGGREGEHKARTNKEGGDVGHPD